MKKFERFLLLAVLVIMSVFMSPSSQVFATEIASSSDSFIQGSFDERTITISSSKDAKFKLKLGVKGKSTLGYVISDTLSINSGETKTYSLENLVSSFSSSDITLNSVYIVDVISSNSEGFLCFCFSLILCIFISAIIFGFVKLFSH